MTERPQATPKIAGEMKPIKTQPLSDDGIRPPEAVNTTEILVRGKKTVVTLFTANRVDL